MEKKDKYSGKDEKIFLETCRTYFRTIYNLNYPDGFSVSPWWENIRSRNIEAMDSFKTPEEAIRYAQTGALSGFDHRDKGLKSVIDYKVCELERVFPGFVLKEHNDLKESVYSRPETIEEVNGIPYSNIFLTHLNFYLRATLTFRRELIPERVLEIGGGYGALARIFKIMNSSVHYTIVDLPESLFFAQLFLMLNFPDAKVCYVDKNRKVDVDEFDFLLVPVQFYDAIAGDKFDIVINTGSLQEMPDITVKFWMNFIQNILKVEMFYSFNYFLNDKRRFLETSKEEANLICPILDPFWKLKYFKINPGLITIDASERNWLELCVERINSEEYGPDVLKRQVLVLFEKARLHPRGSNDWFAYLSMAIWQDPRKEFLQEMLQGIKIFKLGLGTTNNHISQDISGRFTKAFKRFSWFSRNHATKYSEELYFKTLIKKIENNI